MDQQSGSRLHAFDTLQGKSHPLRASLSREMHARKLPRFVAPARVMQIVMLVNEREAVEAALPILTVSFEGHQNSSVLATLSLRQCIS